MEPRQSLLTGDSSGRIEPGVTRHGMLAAFSRSSFPVKYGIEFRVGRQLKAENLFKKGVIDDVFRTHERPSTCRYAGCFLCNNGTQRGESNAGHDYE